MGSATFNQTGDLGFGRLVQMKADAARVWLFGYESYGTILHDKVWYHMAPFKIIRYSKIKLIFFKEPL